MSPRSTVTASSVFHLLVPTELDGELPGPPVRATSVPVELHFDATDPYAVHLRFVTGPDRDVRWVFARILLADGLLARVGEGDVRVRPGTGTADDSLVVELDSPSGHARFEVSAAVIAEFLDSTYDLVAAGREADHVDVDSALTALLTPGGH